MFPYLCGRSAHQKSTKKRKEFRCVRKAYPKSILYVSSLKFLRTNLVYLFAVTYHTLTLAKKVGLWSIMKFAYYLWELVAPTDFKALIEVRSFVITFNCRRATIVIKQPQYFSLPLFRNDTCHRLVRTKRTATEEISRVLVFQTF